MHQPPPQQIIPNPFALPPETNVRFTLLIAAGAAIMLALTLYGLVDLQNRFLYSDDAGERLIALYTAGDYAGLVAYVVGQNLALLGLLGGVQVMVFCAAGRGAFHVSCKGRVK